MFGLSSLLYIPLIRGVFKITYFFNKKYVKHPNEKLLYLLLQHAPYNSIKKKKEISSRPLITIISLFWLGFYYHQHEKKKVARGQLGNLAVNQAPRADEREREDDRLINYIYYIYIRLIRMKLVCNKAIRTKTESR